MAHCQHLNQNSSRRSSRMGIHVSGQQHGTCWQLSSPASGLGLHLHQPCHPAYLQALVLPASMQQVRTVRCVVCKSHRAMGVKWLQCVQSVSRGDKQGCKPA